MTEPRSGSPDGRQDKLREDAASWFARMRRPDADDFRTDFEAWLARDSQHRRAYNRISEHFGNTKHLRVSAERKPDHIAVHSRRRPMVAMVCGLMALALAGWSAIALLPGYLRAPEPQLIAQANGLDQADRSLRLATVAKDVRAFRLPDGSIATLGGNSAITMAYNGSERRLRLEHGRARFDVAHEGRPFIVSAGQGSVTAHGTLFDVAIGVDGRVQVVLLRGHVDVAMAAASGSGGHAIRRLEPGERIAFDQTGLVAHAQSNVESDLPTPDLVAEFDRVPLSQLVAEANRRAALQTRIEDPAVAGLRVSGRFSVNDPEKLAKSLAALFPLTIDRATPNIVILRPNRPPKDFFAPPSVNPAS